MNKSNRLGPCARKNNLEQAAYAPDGRNAGRRVVRLRPGLLRDDAERALQQDAEWLARWTQTWNSVEGSLRRVGTDEFNLSLGNRRAKGQELSDESWRRVQSDRDARLGQGGRAAEISENPVGHTIGAVTSSSRRSDESDVACGGAA